MAKIGLNNFRYSILTEASDGTPSYNGAVKPAKAVSCNVEITNNEATLYADDSLAESDYSFANGTITMGIDTEDEETMAALLGHTYSAETGLVKSADDIAPYVGIGRVVVSMVNNVRYYTGKVLYKCKFQEPSQEDTTQGESLEFGTSELEGSVNKLANGKWSIEKKFTTKADAIAWVEEQFASSSI